VKQLRIVAALAGFLAAALSVAFDDHRLAWIAISLLALALLMKVWKHKRTHTHDDDPLL
jgi:hypothetical protein